MFYTIILLFEEGGVCMQENLSYNSQDVIVMKLLHYFITEEKYSPIILHGVKNEIWLEKQDSDYRIVRIVSDYIHNNEQYEFDMLKTKDIIKTIKRKTFSFKMDTLSIFVNLGENVDLKSEDHISCVSLKNEKDINKYKFLYDSFPDIKEKMNFTEKGVELFLKITSDINKKNMEDARETEDVFKEKKPIVTVILMSINILVFILSMLPGMGDFIIDKFANYGPLVRSGEYYRLITCAFVHVDILHIAFNMYSLYIIGSQIESFFGKAKYLIIYFASAITGSLLSIIFSNIPSIGASGAIFGLLGAMLYFGYYYRVYLGNTMNRTILPIIIANLMLGFMSKGIDNAAHIGGLIGGILLSMAVGVKYHKDKTNKINGIILTILYIAFLVYLGIFMQK